MEMFSIAFALFLLMDAVGNIPLYISFLKGIPPRRQRTIIVREMLIALFIIILFNFVGESLMHFLHISLDTIQIAGGIILFLLCLKMTFPPDQPASHETIPQTSEPFIVPLAVPLVAGPSVLALVMIYAQQESTAIMVGAICIAWAASLLILLTCEFLKRILGARGITAMERLMGLILLLIGIQMFMGGISSFVHKQQLGL
jgi:multiple antibiotic resistance protein